MVASEHSDVFADLAAFFGGAKRKPIASSLDGLLQELPDHRREEVRAFLREQELEGLEDLAAVTSGDLTEVFKATPANFTVGQRSAVRSLCSLAQEQQEAAAAEARRRRWAARATPVVKFSALVALGFASNVVGFWSGLTGWDEVQCTGEARQGDSGLKVLVAGFDGSGSQIVLDALAKIGVEKPYSGEEFSFFVWSGLAKDFWRRRENGLRVRPPFPWPSLRQLLDLPVKELWAQASHSQWDDHDTKVLNGTRPGDLAAAISRCGTQAVALDGVERLTWPVYQVSKTAKVVSLSFQAYQDYSRAVHEDQGLELGQLALALLTAGQYVLPWGLLFMLIDRLNGNPTKDILTSGGPPFSQAAASNINFFYRAEYVHRIQRHAHGGLGMTPDRPTYDRFFAELRAHVPPSRLLELDFRQHTWQDLCKFLGVKSCPRSGRFLSPDGHRPLFYYGRVEVDIPYRVLFYLLFWFVNWKVVASWLLPKLFGPIRLVTKPFRVLSWRLFRLLDPKWFVKVFLTIHVSAYIEAYDMWGPITRFDYKCDRPVPQRNVSGVKVLVAGFAKSGTRTMSRTLWQLGLNGSYHSEELSYYWWGKHHDDYWQRPENGGMWPRPSYNRHGDFSKEFQRSDPEVIHNTPPEELAASLAKCGVEAIAFDAIEKLFWPIYDVSPNVKVISLSWRTFEEHMVSMTAFHGDFNSMCNALGWMMCGQVILPWAALFSYLEPVIASGRVAEAFRQGRPAICQEYPPWLAIFHGFVGGRRVLSHWYSGLAVFPYPEEAYHSFYQSFRNRVPKERLFEWHMKKHRWEDLCRFLEVDPCPRSGKLERAVNVFNFERDFPVIFWARVPLYLLMLKIGWRFWGSVLQLIAYLASGLLALLSRGLQRAGSGGSP